MSRYVLKPFVRWAISKSGPLQTATPSDVKKAFRSLSLKLHPDKSNDPQAELLFRQLVSISDVLKDEGKKAKYDEILVNGLPDWRTGAYYVRRVRKMGLLELSILVSLLVTVGHYLCLLAAYYEKLYTLKERIRRKEAKLKKGEDGSALLQEAMESTGLKRPHFWSDNLLLQTAYFSRRLLLTHVPAAVSFLLQLIVSATESARPPPEVDAVILTSKPAKKPRVQPTLPDLTGEEEEPIVDSAAEEPGKQACQSTQACQAALKRGEWSQEEIFQLVKQVKKWPGGTFNRWDKIACALNRSVDDVTSMYERIRASGQTLVQESCTASLSASQACDSLVETADPACDVRLTNWSQAEQKLFEEALVRFPRGSDDRWDRVAEMMGKTKVRSAAGVFLVMPTHFLLSCCCRMCWSCAGGVHWTLQMAS